MTVFERSDQGLFVDDLSSRRVDDDRTLLQFPDHLFTHQSFGFLSEGYMHAQDIRSGKKLVQAVGAEIFAPIWYRCVLVAVMVDDACRKCVEKLCIA